MVRNKTQVVNVAGLRDRWIRLLDHANNGAPPVYKFVFEDDTDAKLAYHRMSKTCNDCPRLRMTLFKRGNEIYVVKSDVIQEVVVKGL